MILVGDVGGTHVRLACARAQRHVIDLDRIEIYTSHVFSGLHEIVRTYLKGSALGIESACFGVPGPVASGRCAITNLPWLVDGQELGQALGIPSVRLLNDLEATAYGVIGLGPQDVLTLSPGRDNAQGNRAVIAAGTGLGQAGLFWDGTRHHPFATEGGHTDFAPRTDQEWRLLTFLRGQYGRVSVERVVSGPGLRTIFQFLVQDTQAVLPDWYTQADSSCDCSALITQQAMAGSDPVAAAAVRLFISLYGAEAGSLALKLMARGGVYIAGGIAPKILALIQEGTFLESFWDKGRMRELLEGTPVYVVLNSACALIGAATFAERAQGEKGA
jgi:glucokinase